MNLVGVHFVIADFSYRNTEGVLDNMQKDFTNLLLFYFVSLLSNLARDDQYNLYAPILCWSLVFALKRQELFREAYVCICTS